MSLFHRKKQFLLSSRILVVLIIVIAAFLAAFLGQMAVNELSRTSSLIPLQGPIIRPSQDALTKLQGMASDLLATERSASVETYIRVESSAERSADGLVLTNDGWIVIARDDASQELPKFVRLQSGQLLDIIKTVLDPYAPIAFIKVDADNLHPATLSGRRELDLMEPVITMNAEGEIRLSYMAGSFLRSQRQHLSDQLNRFYRLTAGKVGDALYDEDSEVVALIIEQPDNAANAVSAAYIRGALNDVLKNERIVKGSLEVTYIDLTAIPVAANLSAGQNSGALIVAVPTASPAAKSGLRVNDIIVAVEGTHLSDRESLSDIVSQLSPAQSVSMSVLRRGVPTTISVTIGSNLE